MRRHLFRTTVGMLSFFISSVVFCNTSPWSSDSYMTGTFLPIPIVVTLLTGPQTINHTGIEIYNGVGCTNDSGTSINLGSPPTFTFATSATYYLGLSAYTVDIGTAVRSIDVRVDADGGASADVCIPVTCSNVTACEAGSGPFLLTI